MFYLKRESSYRRRPLFLLLFVASLYLSCEQKRKMELGDSSKEAEILTDSSYQNVEDFDRLVEEYESPNREDWQNPDLVIGKFGQLKGRTVADIGAGTGYFSFRLAQKAAKVIAVDIDQRFLNYIEERKLALGNNDQVSRVVTRLAKEDDPLLGEGEVDIALLVNTYYFLIQREQYLAKVKKGLSPQGKVIIVDYKPGSAPVGPTEEVKVSPETAKAELLASGFTEILVDTLSLEFQYIIIGQ